MGLVSFRHSVQDAARRRAASCGISTKQAPRSVGRLAAVSIGVLLMVPTAVATLASLCLIAAVQLQVRTVEEPYLRRVHADAYEAYVSGSGRFLPRLARG